MLLSSTIAAISTPPGKGGVAVIRISGEDALSVAEKIFRPKGSCSIKDSPRRQIYGFIYSDDELIDDVMATYFPAPHSYTGEDVVEISCHGGILITSEVLGATARAGARQAAAGEFTRRAFINGKITLSEADAIGLLLDAKSRGQLKLSRLDARERLGRRISEITEGLTTLLGSIYARIDYPDEDLGDYTQEEISDELSTLIEKAEELISTYRTGRTVREGVTTAIAGKPNAGKSTLYNILTGTDGAIVTDVAGTTRDVLESTVSLGDVMLRLFDTAGIRDGGDLVEKIGIERSKRRVQDSELILALFDSSVPYDSEDEELISMLEDAQGEKIAVITKCDLSPDDEKIRRIQKRIPTLVKISEKDETDAIEKLTTVITRLFTDEKISIGNDAVISSEMHYSALVNARDAMLAAKSSLDAGLPQDLASTEMEDALRSVSMLDGKEVSELIVSDIFSRFCVGK